MAGVRTDPLSADEVDSFHRNGFLFPGKLIDDETVERLRAGLADIELGQSAGGTISFDFAARGGGGVSVPFYFNLWKTRPEFKEVAFSPVAAGWASQLLDGAGVRLLGDNALVKPARTGGELHMHQDYAAWPLATPDALTIWIALDEVNEANGAMRFAAGSHLRGERAPVELTTGAALKSYSAGLEGAAQAQGRSQAREGLQPLTDPESEGFELVTRSLAPGECSFHHCLTWHGSPPNLSDRVRRAFTNRYVREGTIFVGEKRAKFYYTDGEAATPVDAPLGGPNFPKVL